MRVPTMYLLSTGGSKAITLKLGCSAFAEIRSDFQLPSAHLEGTSPHLTSRYSNTSVSPSLSKLLVRLCVCIMRLVHYVSFMSQHHLVLASVLTLIHDRNSSLSFVPFRSQQHLVFVLSLVYRRLSILLVSIGTQEHLILVRWIDRFT